MTSALTPSQHAAERAAKNTAARAVGEIVGKLASLVLVFALARAVGASGVGVYVFALAWAEVATTPIEMGFDRYMLTRVARDPHAADELFFNVIATKLLRALPVAVVSFALLSLLGYAAHTRTVVYLASLALLLDSINCTLISWFNGHERGGLSAITIVVQRTFAAAAGLIVLAAGLGVVAVMGAFAAGMAVALAAGSLLGHRRIGLPRIELSREARRRIRRDSWPFAGQELLSIGIARADILLLSLLAGSTVVGLYGAAYRLFESTMFIPVALTGAFSAMFAYLSADSEPSIHAVFQRAIKLTLFLLVPIGIVLLVLARPLIDLFFGDGFAGSVTPLRLLAPTAVLLAVVLVGTSLVVSRSNPRAMVWVFAVALAVNVAANLALIPALDESGAAVAMLATEAVFAAVVLWLATRAVGRLSLALTLSAPLGAGLVMAGTTAALSFSLPLAIAGGTLSYLVTFVLIERRTAPNDLAFVTELAARRLRRA